VRIKIKYSYIIIVIIITSLNTILCSNEKNQNKIFLSGFLKFSQSLEKNKDYHKLPPLAKSIIAGDLNKVKNSLDELSNINEKIANSKTSLIFASDCTIIHLFKNEFSKEEEKIIERIEENKFLIVKLLLEHGADVQIKDDKGMTAFNYAIVCGSKKTISILIKSVKKENISNILINSIQNGDFKKVNSLVMAGANVNTENLFGLTPLLAAIKNKNINIIKLLLQNKADVNKATNDLTPLKFSIMIENKDIVELLMSNGAQINKKINNQTPLTWAISTHNKEIVKIIFKNGAKINERVLYNNMTQFMYACKIGDKEIIELLISYGADVNEKYKISNTDNIISTLGFVAFFCKTEILELLLNNEFSFSDKEKSEALCFSMMKKNKRSKQLLIKNGAKVDLNINICQKANSKSD